MNMPKTKRNTNPSKSRHDDQACNPNVPSTISIEQDQFVLEQTNAWINNADTKVSVSCGLISAVFAIIAFFCENYATEISRKIIIMHPILSFYAVACACVAVLTFLIALLFYFSAISPRFWGFKKNQKIQPKYSIFFEDISAFSCVGKYVDCVMHVTVTLTPIIPSSLLRKANVTLSVALLVMKAALKISLSSVFRCTH